MTVHDTTVNGSPVPALGGELSPAQPRPHRRHRERWMNRWKPALNAFAITFQHRLFPTDQ